MQYNKQPIGIFDSGFAGLITLKELQKQFPNEDFIYLGDSARLHYGSKSPQIIKKYLQRNLQFLNNLNVKAIAVVCSTASSHLDISQSSIPIYNAISPSAYVAAIATKNNNVGVIGTKATVASKAYAKALQFLKEDISVYQIASSLLVPIVEEGWQHDPLSNLIVHRYVAPLVEAGIDTLILGCTHYQLLKESINKVCENKINVVDTAFAMKEWFTQEFKEEKLAPNENSHQGQIKIYTTDINDNFESFVHKNIEPLHQGSIFEAEL